MEEQKEKIGVFEDVDVYHKRGFPAHLKYWQCWPYNPDDTSSTLWEMELFLVFLVVSKDNSQPFLSFPYDLFMTDYRRHFSHLLTDNLLSTTAGIQLSQDAPSRLGITEKAIRIWYKEKDVFLDFVGRYLRAYEKGAFDGTYNSKHYSCKQSLRKTIELLKSYYNLHGNKFTIKPEWEDIDGKSLEIDPRTRIKEDLLLLENKKLLAISRVTVDDFEGWCIPRIVMIKNMHIRTQIELLKPIEEIEKEIFETKQEKGLVGLVVNEENEVFYDGKKIKEFSSSAKQQIELLKFLISKKGVAVTRDAVFDALGFTSKAKRAPKGTSPMEKFAGVKRGTKAGVNQRYKDRLKDLIKQVHAKLPPESIVIKNTSKEGVFIEKWSTKVSPED